eukprot:s1483_g25.t1
MGDASTSRKSSMVSSRQSSMVSDGKGVGQTSGEEEVDPGVPFPHGSATIAKPPPMIWMRQRVTSTDMTQGHIGHEDESLKGYIKGKGMGKIAKRGRAAMASPTTASIWDVSKPQAAGPIAKKGQAAMGTTSTASSSTMPSSGATPLYGFKQQPIKNYAGAIKEPVVQDLPPRPRRREVEDEDSDGGFELLHEDKEVDPTRRHVQRRTS